MSQNIIHESGAQRSADVDHLRYDLVHPIFMERIAQVLAEGAEKYGEHNWERGFKMNSLFNHLLAHAYKYLSGDRTEDHLGHMGCNIMFLIVESEMRYDQNLTHLRGPGNEITPAMIEFMEAFKIKKAKEKEAAAKEAANSFTCDNTKTQLLSVDKVACLRTENIINENVVGSIYLSDLRNRFFENWTLEDLKEALLKQGYAIDGSDQIVNVQFNPYICARIKVRGNKQQVELVDYIGKSISEKAWHLNPSGQLPRAAFPKFFENYTKANIDAAWEAFGCGPDAHHIKGVEPCKVDDAQAKLREFKEQGVIYSDPYGMIRLTVLGKLMDLPMGPKIIRDAFDRTFNGKVYYDPQEQDWIVRGYTLDTSKIVFADSKRESTIDRVRNKILEMFVKGELLYVAQALTPIAKIFEQFPSRDYDQNMVIHAFNTIGLKEDGRGNFKDLFF